MNHYNLCVFLALGALGLAGCGTDHSGTYKGEATESGELKIAVAQAADVAKNESPPRKVPDATVTVTKDGGSYVVKFGSCELRGDASTTKSAVVKNPCDVKVANWEGKMPLSATLNFDDAGALSMEVLGNMKNDAAVVSYEWTFKGKK